MEFETPFGILENENNDVLEFTPLEFETNSYIVGLACKTWLEFTPLEFETNQKQDKETQVKY